MNVTDKVKFMYTTKWHHLCCAFRTIVQVKKSENASYEYENLESHSHILFRFHQFSIARYRITNNFLKMNKDNEQNCLTSTLNILGRPFGQVAVRTPQRPYPFDWNYANVLNGKRTWLDINIVHLRTRTNGYKAADKPNFGYPQHKCTHIPFNIHCIYII